MEQLRSCVPAAVVAEIDSALKSSDPAAACAALSSFFLGPGRAELAQATEALVDTAPERSPCAKDPQQAEAKKQEGNASYKRREYIEAAEKYTNALQFLSPVASPHETAVCFANRAATLQAQAHREAAAGSQEASRVYREAAERDCSRALRWEPRYTKALFRRGCLRAEGGQLADAAVDLEAALACESATPGQGSSKQIAEALADVRRKAGAVGGSEEKGAEKGKGKKKGSAFVFPVKGGKASSQATQPGAPESPQCETTPGSDCERLVQETPRCEATPGASTSQAQQTPEPQAGPPMKARVAEGTEYGGRGLFSTGEVQPGEVVLQEEAYAAVLLKPLRHTHCHWCFLRLPPAPLACPGCTVPLYCSETCQLRASGGVDLGESERPQAARGSSDALRHFGEHWAECRGAAWAAALPLEATLASRVVCRELREGTQEGGEALVQAEGLLHHLEKLPLDTPQGLVALALLACVTAHCLLASLPGGRLPLPSQVTGRDRDSSYSGEGFSLPALSWRLLRALGELRVNAIGISCLAPSPPESPRDAVPATQGRQGVVRVKHQPVAQALFLTASGFNHSCHPNCHLSFHGRTLSARCLEPGPPRTPLHICYGPQKGEMTTEERQQHLAAKYHFTCTCRACTRTPHEPQGSPSLPLEAGSDSERTLPLPLSGGSEPFIHALRCREAQCGGALGSVPVSGRGHGATGREEKGEGGAEAAVTGTALGPVRCLTCGSAKGYATSQAVERAQQAAANTLALLQTCADGEPSPKALEAASKHLRFLERLLHPMNRDLAKAHDAVAQLSHAAGRPVEAFHHIKEAVKVLEFHYPPGSLQLAEEYAKCAALGEGAADETSKEYQRRALQIREIHYGPEHMA